MLFKILQIRGMVKDAKENPGHFAGTQARDMVVGVLFLPALILLLGLGFLFALAFTHFLGGPYLFFKIIFFIGLFGSFIIGLVIYKLTSVLCRTTKKVVNITVDTIRETDSSAPNL